MSAYSWIEPITCNGGADSPKPKETSHGYSAACPANTTLGGGRWMVRAELGNFEGAVEDAAAISSAPGWRFELGQLQWIRGNFAVAFEEFAPHNAGSSYATQSRVWAHLCQVAHGVQSSLVEDPLIPPPARGLRGTAVNARHSAMPVGEEGPRQPQLWIWDLLTELFLDRIEPNDVIEAARDGLKQSDAWRPPASADDASAIEFSPPLLIWRSQVQFYCGMWFLSKRSLERARLALEDAAHGDHSRTLERLAAAAQLERLDGFRSFASPVQRLTRADPTADNGVSRFVKLDMAMAELSPTPTGVTLNLNSEDLRDSGLRMLLESPNLRFVNRLDLRSTGLSTARPFGWLTPNEVESEDARADAVTKFIVSDMLGVKHESAGQKAFGEFKRHVKEFVKEGLNCRGRKSFEVLETLWELCQAKDGEEVVRSLPRSRLECSRLG